MMATPATSSTREGRMARLVATSLAVEGPTTSMRTEVRHWNLQVPAGTRVFSQEIRTTPIPSCF